MARSWVAFLAWSTPWDGSWCAFLWTTPANIDGEAFMPLGSAKFFFEKTHAVGKTG